MAATANHLTPQVLPTLNCPTYAVLSCIQCTAMPPWQCIHYAALRTQLHEAK